ncbi:Isochorismatase hydrolase [Saitoella complicata NRRL Y-17804]|uniref:Isochorismatase-like domain-containing protein n=1 Tax=Saitoella complicata (strain BCRC 22490 / CBS 7301 / JCM 7358 / NBRC 10748 / NRRL Y-17804) TaxID=698492 RepID=A0A0E9NNN6_SAICN|nr:Isochorismatase hydrolase [Saitoella complicata NRRL Y-17804]ODQ53485.1 Isochorismatase hydrolase [Saitoella complicata NRRL Y-17804]GAO51035.1 hypothetical protein G7K_5147-t1 [Saitoella complicata NRRL Y-17804]
MPAETAKPFQIGTEENHWTYSSSSNTYDLTRGYPSCHPSITLRTTSQNLRIAPTRTALVVIDMQNFFISEKLERGRGGLDLIDPIKASCSALREAGGTVVWVNWGIPENLDGVPPSTLRIFSTGAHLPDAPKAAAFLGFGQELPNDLGPLLVKDSWSAALHPDLAASAHPSDIHIDKFRISAFPGTRFEDTLRARGITTLLFAGVNTDQCVMSSFMDALNAGFDPVLIDDCCATTSPEGAHSACMVNAETVLGFVTRSEWIVEAAKAKA